MAESVVDDRTSKKLSVAAVAAALQLPVHKEAVGEVRAPVIFYAPEVLKHGNPAGGDDNASRLQALIRTAEKNLQKGNCWPYKLQHYVASAATVDLERAHSASYVRGIEKISAICAQRDLEVWPEPITDELVDELVESLQVSPDCFETLVESAMCQDCGAKDAEIKAQIHRSLAILVRGINRCVYGC